MQVLAFTSPSRPGWRWRIVNYDNSMMEESYETFMTIADAVTDGNVRLGKLSGEAVADRDRARSRRW
jgi:hypothetical protein